MTRGTDAETKIRIGGFFRGFDLGTPSPHGLERLSTMPRVTYVPLSDALRANVPTNYDDLQTVLQAIISPLLARDFPDQRVGLRGTTCSIDGTFSAFTEGARRRRIHVKDIEEVLRDGTEMDERRLQHIRGEQGKLSAGNIFVSDSSHFIIPTGFVTHNTRDLREMLGVNTPLARKTFPVLLVYDLEALNLRQAPGQNLQIEPWLKPDRQSSAILRAYIFDFPYSVFQPNK